MDVTKLKTEFPDVAKALLEEGAAAERARIQSIEELANSENADILKGMKFDGKTTAAEAALEIVKAEKAKKEKMASDRAKDAADIPAIKPEVNEDTDGEKARDEMAKGIAAGAKKK